MIRARICDPAGPRWWRIATAVGLLPLALAGVAFLGWGTDRAATMVLSGLAWLVVGRLVVPRLRPRKGAIDLETGAIVVRSAGVVSQRITAARLRAASTSALPGGTYALALVRHEAGDPPLWLELETREDADRVRRALSIGHAGFGALRWPPQRGRFHDGPTAADAVAALGWFAMIGAVWLGATEVALGLALPVVPLTLVAMVMAATPGGGRHRVVLAPQGVHVFIEGRSAMLLWGTIADARVEGTGLAILAGTERYVVSMAGALPAEREHLAAQIRSAVQRSRGEGPAPPEVPASLAVLSRREEGRRAWLERLDATAASMAEGSGYRQAGIEAHDLWTTLDSPDAPPIVRAAAARILARIAPDEAGGRIAKALATEHDQGTRQCIRVALEEDVELAAAELDRLDRIDEA